jgi:hypothetical protein
MNYTNYVLSHVYVVKLKGLQWTGHTYWVDTKKDVAPYSLWQNT